MARYLLDLLDADPNDNYIFETKRELLEWAEDEDMLLDEDEIDALANLKPGQTFWGGGGAGAEWAVKRLK